MHKDEMLKDNQFGRMFESLYVRKGWTQDDAAAHLGFSRHTISDWVNGKSLPSPEKLLHIATAFKLSQADKEELFLAAAQAAPRIRHLPFPRNPLFTGREAQLKELEQSLTGNGSVALTQPVSISGLGGIGKTQLALEYAYRCYQNKVYRAVLWVNAADRTALEQSYGELAEILELPERHEQELAKRVRAVKQYLEAHTNWLLIMDNADNLQLARDFFPKTDNGHILLTTRSQIVSDVVAAQIDIDKMEPEDGCIFLLRRSLPRLRKLPADAVLDAVSSDIRDTALEVVKLLDGHPLALDQAGSYIEDGSSFTEYIHDYHDARRRLLKERGSLDVEHEGKYSQHPETVVVTFELCFDKARERHPMATDILRFCAFLHPDAIPDELFQHDDSFKYGTKAFRDARTALLRYSLIRHNTQEQIFSMHRLVQVVLIDDMSSDLQKQWRERIVRVVNAAFPKANFQEWGRCERLVSHALNCATWTADKLTPTAEAATLFHKSGKYLQGRGRYSVAETLLVRVLPIYEQHFGVEHPNTASALHDLAFNYFKQDKYGQSEPLYQQALAIQEKNLEAGHPAITRSLNHLALLYVIQGNYGLAESLIRRALSIQTKNLEAGYADTTNTALTLALLFLRQGKYRKTEFSFLIAAMFEEVMDTTATAPLLALVVFLHRRGEHELADQVYQYVLSVEEERLGATHPHIQETKRVFTDYLKSIGRDADAAALEVNNELSG